MWTRNTPTESGLYWFIPDDETVSSLTQYGRAIIVQVSFDGDGRIIVYDAAQFYYDYHGYWLRMLTPTMPTG